MTPAATVTPEAVVFFVLAALTVASAAVVVLARSLISSAFALLFTFMGVAGIYFLLGADFLATTQLLIYVGGILILLLFGVMLTHKLYDLDVKSERAELLPSALVAGGIFAILAITAVRTEWALGPGRPPSPTTLAIGTLFLKDYLLPFEAASILLLVALMGAALIVRRKKDA
jgi:NADH-quinone oxidoreductase subunit J